MLKVIHSIDGKEYITDKQLERDIYDELYVHEGNFIGCILKKSKITILKSIKNIQKEE